MSAQTHYFGDIWLLLTCSATHSGVFFINKEARAVRSVLLSFFTTTWQPYNCMNYRSCLIKHMKTKEILIRRHLSCSCRRSCTSWALWELGAGLLGW